MQFSSHRENVTQLQASGESVLSLSSNIAVTHMTCHESDKYIFFCIMHASLIYTFALVY